MPENMHLKKKKPVLIEAMTYRVGHHSTSDDASRYRTEKERSFWEESENPIMRLKKFIERKGWWSEEKDKTLQEEKRKAVLSALSNSEKELKPPLDDLFNDVYDELTPILIEQKEELKNHMKKYPNAYPTNIYKKS